VPRVRDGTLVFPPLLLARRHPVSLPTSARAGLRHTPAPTCHGTAPNRTQP